MTKGIKLDEATKNVIRAEVKEAAKLKDGMTKKQIAELHHIHPTMISKIMNEAPVKAAKTAKPRRKTAKATKVAKKNSGSKDGTNKTNETKALEDQWQEAFNDYIAKRNAAEAARKRVVELVEQLR